jgi:hypothetical protein
MDISWRSFLICELLLVSTLFDTRTAYSFLYLLFIFEFAGLLSWTYLTLS